MTLIGMPDAAKKMGVTPSGARNALVKAYKDGKVNLVQINARAWAIDEAELDRYIQERGEIRPGRPSKPTEQD